MSRSNSLNFVVYIIMTKIKHGNPNYTKQTKGLCLKNLISRTTRLVIISKALALILPTKCPWFESVKYFWVGGKSFTNVRTKYVLILVLVGLKFHMNVRKSRPYVTNYKNRLKVVNLDHEAQIPQFVTRRGVVVSLIRGVGYNKRDSVVH